MKITDVRTLLCTAPQNDIFMKSRERRSAAFIFIETDTELWVEPPVLQNGRLKLSDTPGLGVRLPDGFLDRYPFQRGSGEFNSVQGKVLTP